MSHRVLLISIHEDEHHKTWGDPLTPYLPARKGGRRRSERPGTQACSAHVTTRDPKSWLRASTGKELRCQVSALGAKMRGALWLWGMALFFSGASCWESNYS